MSRTQVLLSLGSNLEPRAERIQQALDLISRELLEQAIPSSLYETEPVGYADQPSFINAAITGTTDKDALSVHRYCKELEQRLGRQHRERWREREIDVDVILCDEVVIEMEALTIPHPRMQERRFVLMPCFEIAPQMVHPTLGKTVQQLLDICPDMSAVNIVE